MKIVIDYGDNIPDETLVHQMEQHKSLVIEKLSPIKKEFNESEGILVLHLNGDFQLKDTPYRTYVKVLKILSAGM